MDFVFNIFPLMEDIPYNIKHIFYYLVVKILYNIHHIIHLSIILVNNFNQLKYILNSKNYMFLLYYILYILSLVQHIFHFIKYNLHNNSNKILIIDYKFCIKHELFHMYSYYYYNNIFRNTQNIYHQIKIFYN